MKRDSESRVLLLSLVVELAFGVSGLLLAWLAASHTVLLDGGYSLICTFTMALSIRVARLVKQPPSCHYPFGRAVLEPLLLIFESLMLITLCLLLMAGAVRCLMNGGHAPHYSLILLYEAVSVAAGLGMMLYTCWQGKRLHSPLLRFESQEWLLDTSLSLTALVSFVIVALYPENEVLTRLTDPLLTLLICCPLLYFPLKTLRGSIRQIFWRKAPRHIQERVNAAISQCSTVAQYEPVTPATVIIGRTLLIQLTVSNSLCDKELHQQCSGVLAREMEGYRLFLMVNPTRLLIH